MLRKTGNLMDLLERHAQKGNSPGGKYPNLETQRSLNIADTLLQQLLPALIYMNGMNVIHRDVKPENILFEDVKGGGYKFFLSDFGLVKDLSLGSAHSPRRGATAFIAPEMRNPSLGPQTSALDLWSLFAVALYVVDKDFRNEVDTFDKTTDPLKTSMKFPKLISERIDFWKKRNRDNGVGTFISNIYPMAWPIPSMRVVESRDIISTFPRTFLEHSSHNTHSCYLVPQSQAMDELIVPQSQAMDELIVPQSQAMDELINQRPMSPTRLIQNALKEREYEKVIPLLESKLVSLPRYLPWRSEPSSEELQLKHDAATVYLATNQVAEAIKLLEDMLTRDRRERPRDNHTWSRLEIMLAAAYLLAVVDHERSEIESAIDIMKSGVERIDYWGSMHPKMKLQRAIELLEPIVAVENVAGEYLYKFALILKSALSPQYLEVDNSKRHYYELP
jgi:serine/threonine protein kinase